MKTKSKIAPAAATLAVMACIVGWARPQEKSADNSSPALKSTPEMDRLKFYLGEWNYTESYPQSDFYPNRGKNTGHLHQQTRPAETPS